MSTNPSVTQALTEAGRLGGLSRSKAKAKAARNNGKLGGRPRKDQIDEIHALIKPHKDHHTVTFAYPGGKARLAKTIIEFAPKIGRFYVEPFAGRANVFWRAQNHLAFRYWWLNDPTTAEFLRLIKTHGSTLLVPDWRDRGQYEWCKTHRREPRAILLAPYLYHGGGFCPSRSGWRGRSTARGGASQAGFQRNIRNAARILQRVAPFITAVSWNKLGLEKLDERDFVYFDPPYLHSQTIGYKGSDIDHVELVNQLKNAQYRWILSEYRQPLYVKAFGNPFYTKKVRVFLGMHGVKYATECMWKSRNF